MRNRLIRPVIVAAVAVMLSACHGWDRPIYQSEPTNGDFMLGTWLTDKNDPVTIFSQDGHYYAVGLDKDGATLLPLYVSQHNDTIFVSIDVTSAQHLPAKDQEQTPAHMFVAAAAKKTAEGLVTSAIDEKALSKILESSGIRSATDICRSLRSKQLPVSAEKPTEEPSLLEQCDLINTDAVERILGARDVPLDATRQTVVKPLRD